MTSLSEAPTAPVISRFEDGILHLNLNRPESRNALSADLVASLTEQFESIAGLADARAVVLRGTGGHFCAGADLRAVLADEAFSAGGSDPVLGFWDAIDRLLRAVREAPVVVIVVCEGMVLGGGFGLACVADITLAHRSARFGLPETTRGLPAAQIAPYLIERMGLPAARRLCLTGAQFDGVEATAVGLADSVFEGEEALQHRLRGLFSDIRRCAPRANALTKHLLMSLSPESGDDIMRQARQVFAAAARGAEAREGIEAILHRRRPRWDYGDGQ